MPKLQAFSFRALRFSNTTTTTKATITINDNNEQLSDLAIDTHQFSQ